MLADEILADAIDDGSARRGWMTELQKDRTAELEDSARKFGLFPAAEPEPPRFFDAMFLALEDAGKMRPGQMLPAKRLKTFDTVNAQLRKVYGK